jgi:hypothetical protein
MLINKDLFTLGYNTKFLLDFNGFRLITNGNSSNLSISLEGYNNELNEWVCLVNEYDMSNLIDKEIDGDYEYKFNISFRIMNKLYDYINDEYYKAEVLRHPRKKLLSLNKAILEIKKEVLYLGDNIDE